MSIRIDCVECGQRMVDGSLQHTKECSANLFKPVIGTDYLRPPGQVISFDMPADRKRFEKNLVGGTGLQLKSPDTKPRVTSKAHMNPHSPIEEMTYQCNNCQLILDHWEGKCPNICCGQWNTIGEMV